MSKKKRILHVIGTLKLGGAEKVAVSFCQYSNKEKYDMDYLVYDESESELTEIVKNHGCNLIRIKKTQNIMHLVKVIKKNGPYDCIHSHLMFHNGLIMLAGFLAGVPIRISHSHSTSSGKNQVDFFL